MMKGLRAYDIMVAAGRKSALPPHCTVIVSDNAINSCLLTESSRPNSAAWYTDCPPLAMPFRAFLVDVDGRAMAGSVPVPLGRYIRYGFACTYGDRLLSINHYETQVFAGDPFTSHIGSTTVRLTESLTPGIRGDGLPEMVHAFTDEATAIGYKPNQLNAAVGFVLFVLALLSTKNVTRVEARLPRAVQRHPGQFGETVRHSHYTLDIPGAREFRQSTEGVGEAQRKRLHIVRGHFADYSEGGGLFGKLHGRYYIAPHVRGSAERGTITKDYRVTA